MRLTNLVPSFLKPVLRPIYCKIHYLYKRITYHPRSRNELYQYWKHPWKFDNSNLPEGYLKPKERSLFLLKIMKPYANSNEKILEIGCNVGRNLNFLFLEGFKKLEGIEINQKAVQLLNQSYPEMVRYAKIYNLPVEEIIKEFKDCEFGIVFTMAVLEHIHTDSEWIFTEMVRITEKYLITIEDERALSWRHFPRKYKKIFEHYGMKQIQEFSCNQVDGLGSNYFARIFKKT